MNASSREKPRSVSGYFLTAIQQGSTVQGLMDRVFDIWYCPSLFLNVSRHIEYYSRYSPEYDVWGPVLQNGMLSDELLSGPVKAVIADRRTDGRAHEPVVFSVNGNSYMLALISSGNTPMGFLIMYCPRFISPDESKEICTRLSEAIAFLIEKDPPMQLSDYDYIRNYIAQELLQFDDRMGNASPSAGSSEYPGSSARPYIRPRYRIAAVSVDAKDRDILAAAERSICRAVSESYSLIRANSLYLFFYGLASCSGDDDAEMEDRLRSIAEKYSIRIAVSSCFDDIDSRHVFRRQAVDLSRMADSVLPGYGVLKADDYYPEQMIYASAKRIGSEALLLSEVTFLRDHDKNNGTEYLDTLCCYLRCSGVIRSAAAKLHIEPKSLRYRIKKICELLGRNQEELLSDTELLLSSVACSFNSEKQ